MHVVREKKGELEAVQLLLWSYNLLRERYKLRDMRFNEILGRQLSRHEPLYLTPSLTAFCVFIFMWKGFIRSTPRALIQSRNIFQLHKTIKHIKNQDRKRRRSQSGDFVLRFAFKFSSHHHLGPDWLCCCSGWCRILTWKKSPPKRLPSSDSFGFWFIALRDGNKLKFFIVSGCDASHVAMEKWLFRS